MLTQVECRVKIGDDISSPFCLFSDLRQGDSLSCLLFKIVLEKVIRDSQLNPQNSVLNYPVLKLGYVDGIALVVKTEQVMIDAFKKPEVSAKRMVLQINGLNTKYMYNTNRP